MSIEASEPNEKLSPSVLINNHFCSLSLSFESMPPKISYVDFEQNMNNVVDDGQVTDCTMNDEWTARISQNNSDRKLNLFKLSFVYSLLAKRAHDDGESDKARTLISKARHFNDLFKGIAEAEAIQNGVKERREKAINAARVRTKNLEPLKNIVIDLLEKLRPDSGWKSELSARKAIKPQFDKLCVRDIHKPATSPPQSSLAPTNSQNTLRSWFADDDKIRAAFNANSFETLSKPK